MPTLLKSENKFDTLENIIFSETLKIAKYELVANGTGVHWESLDEDLSLKGLLRDHMINILKSNYVVG